MADADRRIRPLLARIDAHIDKDGVRFDAASDTQQIIRRRAGHTAA